MNRVADVVVGNDAVVEVVVVDGRNASSQDWRLSCLHCRTSCRLHWRRVPAPASTQRWTAGLQMRLHGTATADAAETTRATVVRTSSLASMDAGSCNRAYRGQECRRENAARLSETPTGLACLAFGRAF